MFHDFLFLSVSFIINIYLEFHKVVKWQLYFWKPFADFLFLPFQALILILFALKVGIYSDMKRTHPTFFLDRSLVIIVKMMHSFLQGFWICRIVNLEKLEKTITNTNGFYSSWAFGICKPWSGFIICKLGPKIIKII